MMIAKNAVKHTAWLLFLLLNFASPKAEAQISTLEVTPDNVYTVLNNLTYSYPHDLGVSENVLWSFFLSSQLSGLYDEAMPTPNPYLIDMDENSITVGWLFVPFNSSIRIKYLNMRTGEVNTAEPFPGTNVVRLPNNYQDRYIYLFSHYQQRRGSLAKSADYIIIEENPVIRNPINIACDCEEPFLIVPSTSFEEVESNLSNILLPSSQVQVDQKYRVDFTAGDQSGNFTVVRRAGKAPFTYDIIAREGCLNNVKSDPNEYQFYGLINPVTGRAALAFAMDYHTGLRMHWLDPSVEGSIRVTDCGIAESSGFNLRQQPNPKVTPPALNLQHFPNPTSGLSTIQYELEQPQTVELWITDARGQIVRVLEDEQYKASGTHRTELDLTELPSGLYMAHFRGLEQQRTLRILKVD
ncbi:MAG: T9SS type A sorting domain-containing protein [Bacteroidota bacterium]